LGLVLGMGLGLGLGLSNCVACSCCSRASVPPSAASLASIARRASWDRVELRGRG